MTTNAIITAAPVAAQPAAVDLDAPATLTCTFTDNKGNNWGVLVADSKQFSSGSVGFFATGKLVNPVSGAKYQAQTQNILVGSKPGSSK